MPFLNDLRRSSTREFLQDLLDKIVIDLQQYTGFWNTVWGTNPCYDTVKKLLRRIEIGEVVFLSEILGTLQDLVVSVPERKESLTLIIKNFTHYISQKFSQYPAILYHYFSDYSNPSEKGFDDLYSFMFDAISILFPEERAILMAGDRKGIIGILNLAVLHYNAGVFNNLFDLIENTVKELSEKKQLSSSLLSSQFMPLDNCYSKTLLMIVIETNPSLLAKLLTLLRFMSTEEKKALLTHKMQLPSSHQCHSSDIRSVSVLDLAISKGDDTLNEMLNAIMELPSETWEQMFFDTFVNLCDHTVYHPRSMQEVNDLKTTMLNKLRHFDNKSIMSLLKRSMSSGHNLWMVLLAQKNKDIFSFFSQRLSSSTLEEQLELYSDYALDGWDALMLEMKHLPISLSGNPGFGLPLLSFVNPDQKVDMLTRTSEQGESALSLSLRFNTIVAVRSIVGLLQTNLSPVSIFKLISLQNMDGDNVLMLAIKHSVAAVELLVQCLSVLDQESLDLVFTQTNSKKMNSSMLMMKHLPKQYELLSPLINRLSQGASDKMQDQVHQCKKPLFIFFLEQKHPVNIPSTPECSLTL